MTPKTELVVQAPTPHAEIMEDTRPELAVGQWFRSQDTDDKGALCTITEIGSNYIEVTAVVGHHWRVHLDQIDTRLEPAPDYFDEIQRKIGTHQQQVVYLMDEVRRVTAALGVPIQGALPEAAAQSQALAVASGATAPKAYKDALILAKDETLPELFKQIKEQHEHLATWMKAPLIPRRAELSQMKGSIDAIDQRIFTVELYAGLVEQLACIREGEPAHILDKIHLFQRRHYMDEECLVQYEAGGMNFEKIEAFDEWLCRDENRNRILPHPRSIVAFRVRRKTKDYDSRINAWIRFSMEQADKWTFLYIRNGGQVWRLSTQIDFGSQLFPNKEDSLLLSDDGEQRWIRVNDRGTKFKGVVSNREREHYLQREAEEEAEYQEKLKAWKRKSKAQRKKDGEYFEPHRHFRDHYSFEPCDPSSVFYDDAIRSIAKEATEHNRVAVVIQGLIDRSLAVHPHPPWKLWQADSFANAIELVYDVSRALTPGEAPDFGVYAAQLRKSIKVGSLTIGQERMWKRREAEKENARRNRRDGGRYHDDLEYFKPYGDDGPGFIGRVTAIRGGKARFEWKRKSERGEKYWEPDPERPGWGWNRRRYPMIDESIWVPLDELFNVSAYNAGDFRMFYDDPRTRTDYLQWAPLLLPAEDYAVKGIGDPDAKPDDDSNNE